MQRLAAFSSFGNQCCIRLATEFPCVPRGRVQVRANPILQSVIYGLLLMFLMTLTSLARDLTLGLGFSEVLKLPRPVGDVIVGNPDVADVTIQSEQQVVITAKPKIGTTNIIILDRENNELFRANIVVGGRGVGKVEVYPQGNRNELHDYYAYSCPPSGRLCQRFSDPNESLTHLELAGPTPSPTTSTNIDQPPAQQVPAR
jgi:hypothetical protein